MKKSMLLGGVVAVALVLTAGGTRAADLTYNTGATSTLTGDVSYGNVAVGVTGGAASTVVDASGTSSFTTSGATFYVGVNLNNTQSLGKLYLGANNSITASTRLVIGGNQPDGDASSSHNGTVTTATGSTTTIATPYMAVGTSKGTGTFTLGSNATLNLGSSGGRTELIVSRSDTSNGYNRPANGNMNLSGGIAKLTLSSLVIGRKTVGGNSNNTYTGTGTLTLSSNAANHLDISGAGNVVRIGYSTISNMGPQGTLTIGNLDATSSITSTDNSTAVLLGYQEGTNGSPITTGTFNFNSGTLTINTTGAAIAGGGGGALSKLYLDGNAKLIAGAASTDWIRNLTTAEIKSGGATIDTAGYDIGVSQAFTGAGGLIKAGEGTLTLSGTNTYGGNTTIEAGTLRVTGTVGASGSMMTVGANGALGGSGTVNGSLYFDAGAQLAFSPTETLTYAGTLVPVSFGAGFGVASLIGLDAGSVEVGQTYTLIAGDVSLAGVANVGSSNAVSIGGGKSAYFQEGSLQLVVIPEPATLGMIGVVGVAMILRRRIVK